MSDSLENGYKHLANDPEMYTRRRPNHHCGFDFSQGLPTAVCNCGAVATNPYYMEQPARNPKELWDEAVAYGKAVENDRIAELIDEHRIENDEGGTGYCQGCNWKNAYGVGFEEHLTELIKGE